MVLWSPFTYAYAYDLLWSIMYEWIVVFSQKWVKFTRATPRGGPEASASLASPQTHHRSCVTESKTLFFVYKLTAFVNKMIEDFVEIPMTRVSSQ